MMNRKKPSWMLLMVLSMAVLLPGLAFMQFRWIGQLSDSELERMRANLNTSAEYFHDAFDREISPLRWLFRVSLTGSTEEVANQLALNYRHWERMTEHPRLIERIYWIDYPSRHAVRLQELDRATGVLREIPWPDSLLSWRDYIVLRNQLQREALESAPARDFDVENDALRDFRARNAALLARTPAIPIPVSIDPEIGAEDLLNNLDATIAGRAGHTLLLLNRTYIVDTLLTGLATEFAGAGDDAGYHVMVVSQDDEELVIFQSDSTLTLRDFEKPDAVHFLGGGFFWQRQPLTPSSMIVRGYTALANRDPSFARLLIDRAQHDWLPALPDSLPFETIAHEPPFPLQAVLRMARENDVEGQLTTEYLLGALTRLQDEAMDQNGPKPPPADSAAAQLEDDGRHAWKMMLKHRTGSLEASVRANRSRNLFMSFGILLLLGSAVALLYNSSRRARFLAEQQMEFVAGISHELRTPLAVIHSAAENLADGVVQSAEHSKRYGDLIRREGRRLTEMVEQVLELAGVQSGQKRYLFRPASIAGTIDQALSSCEGALREADFMVSKTIAPDLPEMTIDDRSLQTALRNLITNAIKYSDGRTWLGIEAVLTRNGKGPEVQVTVRDKGSGIPANELPFIFDRFYRGHAVREAQIHGNGLGLSLVKSTAEAHGGRVTVVSEPGKGSAFTLHLPLRTTVETEPAATA
ncbi:MAG: HAMP domain-containing sensor histidine kinase [Rhodothermales bacterium]|nr:HAMP domain-containing sensor histidine kinase [Rhodothermales bacterium]